MEYRVGYCSRGIGSMRIVSPVSREIKQRSYSHTFARVASVSAFGILPRVKKEDKYVGLLPISPAACLMLLPLALIICRIACVVSIVHPLWFRRFIYFNFTV